MDARAGGSHDARPRCAGGVLAISQQVTGSPTRLPSTWAPARRSVRNQHTGWPGRPAEPAPAPSRSGLPRSSRTCTAPLPRWQARSTRIGPDGRPSVNGQVVWPLATINAAARPALPPRPWLNNGPSRKVGAWPGLTKRSSRVTPTRRGSQRPFRRLLPDADLPVRSCRARPRRTGTPCAGSGGMGGGCVPAPRAAAANPGAGRTGHHGGLELGGYGL